MSNLLVQIAKQRFENPASQIVHFVDNKEANSILNDLENYPHAYVLACLMDRQIKAERAWKIPFEIFSGYGTFEIDRLADIELGDLKEFFNRKKLHRFNDTMAEIFYFGIKDIKKKYGVVIQVVLQLFIGFLSSRVVELRYQQWQPIYWQDSSAYLFLISTRSTYLQTYILLG
jgi:hypothetical protein